MKKFFNQLLVKLNLKPHTVVKLQTGLLVGHYNNGKIKVLNYDS